MPGSALSVRTHFLVVGTDMNCQLNVGVPEMWTYGAGKRHFEGERATILCGFFVRLTRIDRTGVAKQNRTATLDCVLVL